MPHMRHVFEVSVVLHSPNHVRYDFSYRGKPYNANLAIDFIREARALAAACCVLWADLYAPVFAYVDKEFIPYLARASAVAIIAALPATERDFINKLAHGGYVRI